MRLAILIYCFVISSSGFSQTEVLIDTEVSADTIYMDNAFSLVIRVKNGSIQNVDQPKLKSFDLLQGPGRSSSISIINGVRSSEETLSYYFRPIKPGKYSMPSYTVIVNGTEYKTEARSIIVVPNPEGWHQDPNTGQVEGRPTKKRTPAKRKRYRI